MLEEILGGLGWWKYPVKGRYVKSIVSGSITISSGSIKLDAADGQFIRIVGSAFNDGIHAYGDSLFDETFDGEVWVLTVPPDLMQIVGEIETYQASEAAKPSPYNSESFGGYSYTRATNASGQAASWKDVYASRLQRWRKV